MVNEQTTGSDGKATFENTEYGDYTLTIEADGYITKTENIAFRSNHKNFTIALEQSGGTGTVTVTCQDESENPLANTSVMLATVEQVTDPQTQVVCGGITDENGTVTLKEMDWELKCAEQGFGTKKR